MLISLALVFLCTAAGTIATYTYDERAPLSARVFAGACIGLTAFGLVGFIVASFLGLTPLTIEITSALIALVAIVVLRNRRRRETFRNQLASAAQFVNRAALHPTLISVNVLLFLFSCVILWRVFDRAVIEDAGGLYTGLLNNFGDLPFHLSVITGFVYGNNFPPEDPTYAGVRFTYPFLTDFISAMFVRCGASLSESLFIENIVVAVSFVGLVYRWALVMLKDRLAATLTPFIVLLNGGFGFGLLWSDLQKNNWRIADVIRDLPPSFTIVPETTWRWGNAISTLLVPQRGILLGLALAVIVFTQWWLSEEEPEKEQHTKKRSEKKRKHKGIEEKLETSRRVPILTSYPLPLPVKRMIAAGVIAGFLPLVHAHSFVVVMVVGACIALFRQRWRDWFVFFVVASVIALPQMWWSTHNSAVDAKKFIEWQFGWDRGESNALWFWFENTGIFIPLLLIAILWRGRDHLVSKRLLYFYLPFTLCFIIPNVIKLAPWVWDNIKVLYYWWLASAPIIALLISRLWREGSWSRGLAVVLLVLVTLAGTLDVALITLRSTKYQIFDRNGMDFAELIKSKTDPRALIVHAPVHNDPVFLTGRRSLMGYPGHIWTHGLEFSQRESEIRRIYGGAPDAALLLQQNKIEYAVVGPHEHNSMRVNDQFFSLFQKVGEVGEYSLYKTR